MAKHARSVDTKAPPERVWRIWSDVSTWPQWNPDVTTIRLEGPFISGTQGSMTTKAGGTHRIELADVRVGRSFHLETSPIPLGRFSFQCEIAAAGDGSRLSQGLAIMGPLGWLFSPMMGERIAQSFVSILRGLAQRAEEEGK